MSIRSMTGFGRIRHEIEGVIVTFELQSVNNRYCSIQSYLPKHLSPLEPRLREFLESSIHRGKVTTWLTYNDLTQSPIAVSLDFALLESYIEILSQINRRLVNANLKGIPPEPLRIEHFLHLGELIRKDTEEADIETAWKIVYPVIHATVGQFNKMREAEGERTATSIRECLSRLENSHKALQERVPLRLDEYRARLQRRINELAPDIAIEPNRLAMEVALWADRVDIHEELSRFVGHLVAFRQVLDAGGEVGVKLNFLVQELQREATTAGNKANDLQSNQIILAIKQDIEKIREQVQNLE